MPQVLSVSVIAAEFVFAAGAFPECHASTIIATERGLAAAWFAGAKEGAPDVGIWLSWNEKGSWSRPELMAVGQGPQGQAWPCWNPVLYQPRGGDLNLFYKVGPDCSIWRGWRRVSRDGGRTWAEPEILPENIPGPIKNKPVQMPDGTVLSPSSEELNGWQVFILASDPQFKAWRKIGPLNRADEWGAIQPSILEHGGGRLSLLCRTRQGCVAQAWSEDFGQTWSPLQATALPNPNSGTDAVTLHDGRHLLVYNHTGTPAGQWGGARSPLNLALSADGRDWQPAGELETEPGEYSYPAVIQAADGLVHVTYTWKRKNIKHVVIRP